MLVTQVCSVCGIEKPLTGEYFYKEPNYKNGYRYKCKECYKRKPQENFNIEEWYQSMSDSFKQRWSWKDIKWMYDNYLNIIKQELLDKFPGIGYKTLTNIIYKWDIKKIDKNDNWSEEDMDKLIKVYKYMSQNDLAKLFPNRTWIAIKIKANKLNITRDEETLHKIKSDSQIGKIIPLEVRMKIGVKGDKNYNWKGGVSPLHPYLRDKIKEWRTDSFEKYDFKCAFTNINDGTLIVHHLHKSFSEIIQETFVELNLKINSDMTIYTSEELNNINEKFKELHYRYGLGIPILAKIHRLFHSLYGKTNNTPEQFYEFTTRYRLGEFSEDTKSVSSF